MPSLERIKQLDEDNFIYLGTGPISLFFDPSRETRVTVGTTDAVADIQDDIGAPFKPDEKIIDGSDDGAVHYFAKGQGRIVIWDGVA